MSEQTGVHDQTPASQRQSVAMHDAQLGSIGQSMRHPSGAGSAHPGAAHTLAQPSSWPGWVSPAHTWPR